MFGGSKTCVEAATLVRDAVRIWRRSVRQTKRISSSPGRTQERVTACGTSVARSSPFLESRRCFSFWTVRRADGRALVRFPWTVISTAGCGDDGVLVCLRRLFVLLAWWGLRTTMTSPSKSELAKSGAGIWFVGRAKTT